MIEEEHQCKYTIECIKEREKCVDGTSILEIFLDPPVDRDIFNELKSEGSGKILENLQRPFFRIRTLSGEIIKGVIGQNRLTLILSTDDLDVQLKKILTILNQI
jgi:hypothetical protein